MHNNNNYQCKMCWNKALTFGVGSIQLIFRTIVFTQYMQRCFQSKCYYISVKLRRGFALSAFIFWVICCFGCETKLASTDSPPLSLFSPVVDSSLPQSLKHIVSNAEYYGPSIYLPGNLPPHDCHVIITWASRDHHMGVT